MLQEETTNILLQSQ